MNVPDTHPLLLANLKAQSDSAFLRTTYDVLGGYGAYGAKPRPYKIDHAVRSFSSWCYVAAMLNAGAFAAVPLRLFVRKRAHGHKLFKGEPGLFRTRPVSRGRKDYLLGYGQERPSNTVLAKVAEFGADLEEVTEPHPALQLLASVNDWMNGFELQELKLLYLQMTGNYYQLQVSNGRLGIPSAVWPLPSQYVKVVPDAQRFVSGFKFGTEPGTTFAAEDVIQWKLPNLCDPYYGMGRMEAVWSAVGLSKAKRIEDIAVKENFSRPDWMIGIEGASSEALTRLENSIEQRLRGTHNRGKVLAANGKVTATALNQPVGELGDPQKILEEIASGFGVPIMKLTGNDPVKANAETGDAGWLRDTILPYCRRDEEQLNARYLPLFDDGDAVLAYDNPVPKNETAEADRRVKYVAGGIVKPNEARAELGLPPEDGGETLLVPSGVVPIGQAGANPLAGLFNVTPNAAAQPGIAAPLEQPGEAQQIQTTEATVLNGAQVTAAANIVAQVTAGTLPRDSGVAQLQVFFNLTPQVAEQVMGSAGTSKPTTANPNPAAEAAAQQAAEAAGAARTQSATDDLKAARSDRFGVTDSEVEVIPPDSKKNCGDGDGGFQPGNDCSGEGGGGTGTATANGRRFEHSGEANDWADEHYTDWFDNVSTAERQSMEDYKRADYKNINGYLRASENDPKVQSGPKLKAAIKNLDGVIAKSSVPDDVVVYRGLKSKTLHALDESAIGTVVRDPGFASTTMNETVATGYFAAGAANESVVMEIKLPKGAKAAYLDYDPSVRGSEAEMLLPRNTAMKVVGVSTDADGKRRLTMALMKSPKPKKQVTDGGNGIAVKSYAAHESELATAIRAVFAEQKAEAMGWAEGKTLALAEHGLMLKVDRTGSFDELYPYLASVNPKSDAHPRILTKDDDRNDKPKPQPPAYFLDLAKWDKRLAEAARPVVEKVLRDAAKATAESLKVSDATWRVIDRNLPQAAERLALKFAESTNATTSLKINEALADLRQEITEGVTEGDTPAAMTERVQKVFEEADTTRAEAIAKTETSRARHTAEIDTAKESGVVKLKKWLASSDACDICEAIAAETGEGVPLDQPYAKTDSKKYPTIDSPPAHPNCFLPETPVLAPGRIKAFDARYDGPVVRLEFSNGRNVAVTPNHPLLTPFGFVAASALRKGDKVIDATAAERKILGDPNDNRQPPAIKDVVASLSMAEGMTTGSVPVSPVYLHGDAAFVNGDIKVVAEEGFLRGHGEAGLAKGNYQPLLGGTDAADAVSLAGGRDLHAVLVRLRDATDGGVSSIRDATTFGRRHASHADRVGFGASTRLDTSFNQSASNAGTGNVETAPKGLLSLTSVVAPNHFGDINGLATHRNRAPFERTELHASPPHVMVERHHLDADRLGDCLQSLASVVTTCEVSEIRNEHYVGHVYDLQTESSLYIANGVIASNCQCSQTLVLSDEFKPRE